jgi:cob(I)alamin adenosyltransferase
MPRMYTRTGDKGETGLFSGERVSKHSLRIEAYGTVDELSSWIGYARSLTEEKEIDELLEKVQRDLFVVGADLATRIKKGKPRKVQVSQAMIKSLEEEIDGLDEELPALSTFIVPSGTKAATTLHVARTVARRAERRTLALARKEEVNPHVVTYLNRLSSLLYALARVVNKRSGVQEAKWAASRVI